MRNKIKTIVIDQTEKDLDLRYSELKPYIEDIKPVLNNFLNVVKTEIEKYMTPIMQTAFWAFYKPYLKRYSKEMESYAKMLDVNIKEVYMINCYYDFCSAYMKCDSFSTVISAIFKKINPFACTAFAYDSPNGPVHARNLDWWDEGNLLLDNTVIIHHKAKLKENSFKTVSWPGVSGVLSGIKEKYFTITLNMTSSDEFEFAQPVVFLIRRVLEEALSFDEAVSTLSKENILSDCLLLVTGINKGEMVVIERTPTQSAIRYPQNGFIAVTNDYIKYSADNQKNKPIVEDSCGRYNGITSLLKKSFPKNLDDCYNYLSDYDVKMDITLQQMVMCANSGEIKVRRG